MRSFASDAGRCEAAGRCRQIAVDEASVKVLLSKGRVYFNRRTDGYNHDT